MFAQYFGQFLLNEGLVTTEQLEKAMTAQQETRVKLGVLAINLNYMTAEQVEITHQAQMQLDKRFGELAVERGYLTAEQLDALLASQQSAHLALGQALIDLGIFGYDRFESALRDYKRQYSLSDEQFEAIIGGSIDALLESVLLRNSGKLPPAVLEYISLFAKNMIRFIDSGVRLELAGGPEPDIYAWTASQLLCKHSPAMTRMTAIVGSEEALLQLASLYAQETVDEPGEMMEASAGEFLNLHNGIFLVNLSNQGVELVMLPQTVIPGGSLIPAASACTVVKVFCNGIRFDLIVADLSELL